MDKMNKDVEKRWMDCKILVVDEISMIDGNLFDKVEQIARIVNL